MSIGFMPINFLMAISIFHTDRNASARIKRRMPIIATALRLIAF